METELYWQDILLWSESQGELLRRLARGERVEGVDWNHVIEEVEGVGRSELHSVEILLVHAIVHLLKAAAWPHSRQCEHWRCEVVGLLIDAECRFEPSMRQRIDVAEIYGDALKQLHATTIDGQPPGRLPNQCPFTLDALLAADRAALEAQLRAALRTQLDADRHVV